MIAGPVARLRAIVRRDALIQVSYQFQLLTLVTAPFVTAFLAYYVSGLIEEPEPLQPFDGGYFEYVIAGVGLTSYAGFGVSAFNTQMRAEQGAGTLEVLLSGPSRLALILVGGAIVPFALITLQVGALYAIGLGFVGVGISWSGLLTAVPLVAMTAATFCALGILSAALVLLVKRGDPISGPIYQLTLLLSGAVIPIELFPGWMQFFCRLTPAYYGVRGVREALLTDAGLSGVLDELAILSGFAVVLLPLSTWVFARSVRRAKVWGVLGSY